MRRIVLVIYSMACCAARHTCSCTSRTDDCPSDTSTVTFQNSSAESEAAVAMNRFTEVIDRLHLFNVSSRKRHGKRRDAFECDLRLITDHWKRLDKENYPELEPLQRTKDEERVKRLRESNATPVSNAHDHDRYGSHRHQHTGPHRHRSPAHACRARRTGT